MGKTYECGVSLEKAQLLEPGLDVRPVVGGEGLGDGGIGAQLGEDVQAVVDGIAGAGAEGDNGLARKVVGLQESGNHGGGLLPPDGIVKCSPSSPALENTGLNGLHKCVFCSFLVAYCSDLSHLLYSASPVYTNTYV